MKLPSPIEGHANYRELISTRLDQPLSAPAEGQLEQHLASCSRCRSVERDYRAQRARLAALPEIPAPRDLWARTAAALDTEMARSPRSARRAARADRLDNRGPSSRLLAISAATSVALALVVMATQLNGAVKLAPTPNHPLAVATPFDVPPEPVVIADFSIDGVTVYQSEVAQVCPTPMIECSAADVSTHPVLRITGSGGRSGTAVQSAQGRLALLAVNEAGQETISVVTLPSVATGSGSSAATGSSSPAPGTGGAGANRPPGTPGPTRPLSASPVAPKPTENTQQVPNHPDGSTTATHRPTRSPRTPARTPTATRPGSQRPGSTPVAPGLQSGSPAPDGSMSVVPVAILDRVRTAGAPAAWSSDGDMLAFSAMPADRSTGPDVYVWHPGDARAERLTGDHNSYFASWAGERIVVSRVMPSSRGKSQATGTFVLDPANGEMRQVAVKRMWLPAVDPKGRWAVAWKGTLVASRNGVTPSLGGLYLVDWRSVDPFVDQKAVVDPLATPGPAADAPGHEVATPKPNRGPRQHGRPAPIDRPLTSLKPAAPASSPSGTNAAAGTAPQAVEPDRDESADPVLEWQVRWSERGGTFAYWIADAPGANWGRLAVLRLLPGAAGIDFNSRPLDPTLARRSFSLGSDRVAWIAASDDVPSGELRLRTWDVHGYGGLRIHDLRVDGGVPAY